MTQKRRSFIRKRFHGRPFQSIKRTGTISLSNFHSGSLVRRNTNGNVQTVRRGSLLIPPFNFSWSGRCTIFVNMHKYFHCPRAPVTSMERSNRSITIRSGNLICTNPRKLQKIHTDPGYAGSFINWQIYNPNVAVRPFEKAQRVSKTSRYVTLQLGRLTRLPISTN